VFLREVKNDPSIHSLLDPEEECKDNDAIIGAYSMSDVVSNGIMSQLILQLVEK